MGYNTDLTDKQWLMIESFFKSNKGKHLVKHSKRDLVNAVVYLNKTGCQWRLLPNDFPPHDTVWSFYRRAVKSGKWEKVLDCLVKKHANIQGENQLQPMELSTHRVRKLHQRQKDAVSTEEKNERPKTPYCNGYNRKPIIGQSSRGKYTRHSRRRRSDASRTQEISFN